MFLENLSGIFQVFILMSSHKRPLLQFWTDYFEAKLKSFSNLVKFTYIICNALSHSPHTSFNIDTGYVCLPGL